MEHRACVHGNSFVPRFVGGACAELTGTHDSKLVKTLHAVETVTPFDPSSNERCSRTKPVNLREGRGIELRDRSRLSNAMTAMMLALACRPC
jgi:hypothetical protein